MTLDEKRRMVEEYCEHFDGECVDCPLFEVVLKGKEKCYTTGANIERNYAVLFGADEGTADMVNHPGHYETGKFECIDVMCEAIGLEDTKGFCLCNAFKYIYRCTKKHETPVEDVKKAIWYLNKFLELEERKPY